MIKEVFNSITNGAGAAKAPAVGSSVAGSSLENQAGESQGFFGKMFMAFQQEDQQVQEHTLNTSGGKQEEVIISEEPESKEGREAVKQALLNLMNGGKPTSSEGESLIMGEETVEEAPQNLGEQNPIQLVVKTTEDAAAKNKVEEVSATKNEVKEVSTDAGVLEQEKVSIQKPSEGSMVELVGSEQEAQPNTVIPEVTDDKAPILQDVKAETTVSKTNVEIQKPSQINVEIQQPVREAETKVNLESNITVNPEIVAENTISEKGSDAAPKAENLKVGETVILQPELQSEEVEQTNENVSRLKIINRETTTTSTTSEKPATEPQKQAPFTTKINQISNNETAHRNDRSPQPFQQMSQQQVLKNELSSQLHVQNEVKAQYPNEERAKRYDFTSQSSDGKTVNGERLEVAAGSGSSSRNQQGASFSDTPNWLKFQAANQQKAGELNNPQQAFLDEHLKEVTENGDDITSDKNQNGMHRLGEIPVQNALIRKSVLPGLTSIMQKATASGKEVPQSWQKHSFELDDGNKIELSTRNSDGVIQLKIASSNHELTKLLQQYGQEIKEHLEKECELNIDLQFSENQDDGLSEFFGNSSSSGKGKSNGMIGSTSTTGESSKAQKPLQESVRRFGYNQMEWTA